ncbi:MAG: hypothetical protein V1827_04715 [Candidatus Micrarchaeota archaeon]
MKLKHGSSEQGDGILARMKANAARVWERAKDNTAHAVAATALVAALAGASACDRSVGTDNNNDAAVQADGTTQNDGGVQNDGTVQHDAGPDAGRPDSGPEQMGLGQNLIGDYMNRRLGDREQNSDPTDSDQAYEIGGSDTSANANPFTNGVGGDIGVSEQFMFRFSGSDATELADVSLTDDDSGHTYVEKQDVWVKGDNRFDSDSDDVVGRVGFIAYTLKFDGPGTSETGIPVCTVDASGLGDYTSCKSPGGNYDDATESHRVRVKFLGEEWILSEMTAPPDNDVASEFEVRNGGSIKLAQEAVSGIINQGDSLPVNGLKFMLNDIVDNNGVPRGVIDVLDANDNLLKRDMVNQGETKEFLIEGVFYRFHVYAYSPGYTMGAKWAEAAILSHEMEMIDGQELDQDNGNNPGVTVALGWKNRESNLGSLAPDSLRSVIIYSDSIEDISSSGSETLQEGDFLSMPQDPGGWQYSYMGLNLTAQDVQTLRFEIKTTDKAISESNGPIVDGSSAQCTVSAPYLSVTSSATGSVFSAARKDAIGTLSDDEFMVVLSAGGLCTNSDGVEILYPGSMLMKVSPNSNDYGIVEGMEVKYEAIGNGVPSFAPPSGGAIVLDVGEENGLITELVNSSGADCVVPTNCIDPYSQSPNRANLMFAISEYAGAGYTDYFVFGVALSGTGNAGDATFDFNSTDAGGFYQLTSYSQEILYGHATTNDRPVYYSGPLATGPVTSGTEMVEEGYVSERGSKFKVIDNDTVEFSMAGKLAKAMWRLAKGGQ